MKKKPWYNGQNLTQFAKSDYGAVGFWLVEHRKEIQKLQNQITATVRREGWVANIKYRSGPAIDAAEEKVRWWVQVTLPSE